MKKTREPAFIAGSFVCYYLSSLWLDRKQAKMKTENIIQQINVGMLFCQ